MRNAGMRIVAGAGASAGVESWGAEAERKHSSILGARCQALAEMPSVGGGGSPPSLLYSFFFRALKASMSRVSFATSTLPS